MDNRANMKMRSNVNDQNKNFKIEIIKVKPIQSFNDQKCTLV